MGDNSTKFLIRGVSVSIQHLIPEQSGSDDGPFLIIRGFCSPNQKKIILGVGGLLKLFVWELGENELLGSCRAFIAGENSKIQKGGCYHDIPSS